MQQVQSKGSLVGIVVIAGIVLFIAMAIVGPGSRFGTGWSYLTSGNSASQSQAPATGSSIVGGPSISAAKIDTILTSAASPAAGTGADLYTLGVQYGINPAFALAVFKHESNYGKYGVANQSLSLGNLRCIPDAACVNDYAYFNSWQDGYRAFYALISGPLYKGSGLTTPEAIMTRYAPSGDGNDPTGYASDVEQSIQAWRLS